MPPVATITSVVGSLISASIRGIVGSSTTCTQPSGAPAPTAASARWRTASADTSRARGWGLTTTALRVISASSTLKYTVAIGLVDGVSARTTPAGRGISTMRASASILALTKSLPPHHSTTPFEHASFLITLWSATPIPVSSTAHSAYLCEFWYASSATASTIRRVRSRSNSA